MITKSLQRLIRQLDTKRGRLESGMFLAEGPKVVAELWGHYALSHLVVTTAWAESQEGRRLVGRCAPDQLTLVDDEELRRVSLLQHPQHLLATFCMPSPPVREALDGLDDLTLALDGVQDPGNMGTIVRVADWFGVRDIYCSADTCDIYNPKVVQATMGSIARVRVHYLDLEGFVAALPDSIPVYGTSLQGENIYAEPLAIPAVVVMGNEGRGVSAAVQEACTRRLRIPSYADSHETAESLNVAMATGIVLAEFRRQQSLTP